MAKLYFRYGAMNSGKSTHLLQTAYNYEEIGKKVLILKSSVDTKCEDSVVSRLGASRKVDILAESDESLIDRIESYLLCELEKSDISCILVDEVQFMSALQIEELLEVANRGIPVICYGLRTDFLGKGFEGSTRLLQIAHSIEEQKTMCSCGTKAIFNVRMKDGDIVTEGEKIMIDENMDSVRYTSVCSKCRARLIEESKA